MAEATIEVVIAANIAALEKGLKASEKAISNLQDAAGDTAGLDELSKALEKNLNDAKKLEKEFIKTEKTTEALVDRFKDSKLSAEDLTGAFSSLGGAAGEAAEAASSLLQGFTSAGLAGLAVAGLAIIVDQWDKIALAIGETEAVLNRLLEVQNQNLATTSAALAAQRARIKFAEDNLATEERVNEEKAKLRTILQDAIDGEKARLDLLKAQKAEEIGSFFGADPDEIRRLNKEILEATTNTIGFKSQLAEVDRELSALPEIVLTAPRIQDVTAENLQKIKDAAEAELKRQGQITARVELILDQAAKDEFQEELNEFKEFNNELSKQDPIVVGVGFGDERGEQDDLFGFDLSGAAAQIGDIGTAIGDAISTGGNAIQAAGDALLGTFANFLNTLGDQLIQYGLAAKAFDLLTKSFGTPAGLGAAVAAIGAGIALKAVASGIASSVRGGFSGAGGAGGVSATGGGSTSVQSPSFAPSEQVVIFEIAGKSLIGVLNNNLSARSRLDNAILG